MRRWLQIAALLLATTPCGAAEAQTDDHVSSEQIASAVRRLRGAIDACHAAEARDRPHAEPIRVNVDLTIAPDGSVSRAEASGGGSPPLHRCIERAFRAMRFARARQPTQTQIPLIFNPTPSSRE